MGIFKLYFSSSVARWFPRVFFFSFFLPLLQYFQKKIFKENSQERKKLILYYDSNRKIQNSDFVEEQEEKDLYILILIFASTLLLFPRNWNDKIKGKIFFFLHLWSFFLLFFFLTNDFSRKFGEKIYIYIQNFTKYHFLSNYVYILIKYIYKFLGLVARMASDSDTRTIGNRGHINLPRADR